MNVYQFVNIQNEQIIGISWIMPPVSKQHNSECTLAQLVVYQSRKHKTRKQRATTN